MDRIIKFKGKRKDNGKWIYGNLIYDNISDKYWIDLSINEDQMIDGGLYIYAVEVIPETIGQFTGLYDKNRKEIYEGDIAINKDAEVIGKIIYNKDEACFYYAILLEDNKFDEENIIDYIDDLEVIGNIYDNKNLFKEE